MTKIETRTPVQAQEIERRARAMLLLEMGAMLSAGRVSQARRHYVADFVDGTAKWLLS